MPAALNFECWTYYLVHFFTDSGGDLDLVVASDKEVKVSPIREAFQHIFGKATIT